MKKISIRELENLAFGISTRNHIKYVDLNLEDKTARRALNLLRGAYPDSIINTYFPESMDINESICLLFFILTSDEFAKQTLFSKVKFESEGKTAVRLSTNEERESSRYFARSFDLFIEALSNNVQISDYVDSLEDIFGFEVSPTKFNPENKSGSSTVLERINHYLTSVDSEGKSNKLNVKDYFNGIFLRLESPEVSDSYLHELIIHNINLRELITHDADSEERFLRQLYDTIHETMKKCNPPHTDKEIEKACNLFLLDYQNRLNSLLNKFVTGEKRLQEKIKNNGSKIDIIQSYIR